MKKRFRGQLLCILCVLMTVFLASCKDDPVAYTVTFDSDGGSVVESQSVEEGQKANEPTAPTKEGYTFEGWYLDADNWRFSLDSVNSDITLKAKWNPIEYEAKFYANGILVDIIKFTSDNKNIEPPVIPNKSGYTAKWEDYILTNSDISINPVYSIITYTATFKADGAVVATIDFTVETKSIDEPTVPEKLGFTGIWESYSLIADNITVNAEYLQGEYIATFIDGDAVVGRIGFTADDTEIPEPEVPFKQCYTGRWENYTLVEHNIFIKAEYTLSHSNLSHIQAKSPQCNSNGNIEYWSCTGCNKYFSNPQGTTEITDKNSVILNEVPCSYVDCICKWCGDKNHSLAHHERIEPSCNKTGNIEYWSCSKCNKNFSDTNADNTASNTVLSEVPCSYVDCICKRCGGKNHSLTHHERIEPQCNQTGIIEYWSCSKCNKNFSDANCTAIITDQNAFIVPIVDCVFANGYCKWCGGSEGLIYTLNSDSVSYTVKNATCTQENIVIPITHKGLPITSIGEQAFSRCSTLTNVTLPGSITIIDKNAFYYCTNLTSVTIPDSVTSIGDMAFNYCVGLTRVDIPANVKSIGEKVFENCQKITTINVSTDNSEYKSIDGNLYSKDGKTLIQYATNKLDTSFVIPDSVTSISDGAFTYSFHLTSITVGKNVTKITTDLFVKCEKLIEVINKSSLPITQGNRDYDFEVHSGETKIIDKNGYLFYTINGINYLVGYKGNDTVLTLPADYNGQNYQIYKGAFQQNYKITSVIISDGVTSIGEFAFAACGGITSVIIGNNVSQIGRQAFYWCTGLENITIGDSVANLKFSRSYDWPFCYCTKLTNITVSKNNANYKSIDGNLYSKDGKELILYAYGKTDTSFIIPDGVTAIYEMAFHSCSHLTSVTIPDSFTNAGSFPFGNCISIKNLYVSSNNTTYTSIDGDLYSKDGKTLILYIRNKTDTSFIIPNSVTRIGNSAFYDCDSLTSVTIPNGVISIGDYAFSDCDNLTSITIPDSVTSIGYSAFENCKNLTNITIGNGVTSIGFNAFSYTKYCADSANWENGVLYIGKYLIGAHSLSGAYSIKDGTICIADQGLAWCNTLTSVTIPDSVTSIGDLAFHGCNNLTTIKYRGTKEQWNAILKGSGWDSYTCDYTITYNYTGE